MIDLHQEQWLSHIDSKNITCGLLFVLKRIIFQSLRMLLPWVPLLHFFVFKNFNKKCFLSYEGFDRRGKKEIATGDIKNKTIISGNKVISTIGMKQYKSSIYTCINQTSQAECHRTGKGYDQGQIICR